MSFIKAFIQGFVATFQYKKVVFLAFFFNLVFGLIVAIPFGAELSSAIGSFASMNPLALEFDYTLYQDFNRHYGDGVMAIFGIAKWLVPFYILLQIFISGGIINAFTCKKVSYGFSDFYSNSTSYFWRYLRVFLIFLIFHLIASIIVFVPASIAFSKGINEVSSEIYFFNVAYWTVPIYFLLFTLVMTVSDYTKVLLAQNDSHDVFRTAISAWGKVIKNIFNTYGLFLLNFIFVAIIYFIYWKIGNIFSPSTVGLIIVYLLIQQTINIIRSFSKVAYFGQISILSKDLGFGKR